MPRFSDIPSPKELVERAFTGGNEYYTGVAGVTGQRGAAGSNITVASLTAGERLARVNSLPGYSHPRFQICRDTSYGGYLRTLVSSAIDTAPLGNYARMIENRQQSFSNANALSTFNFLPFLGTERAIQDSISPIGCNRIPYRS
ncbi:hypothetical protein K0M31_008385 [Melipona bicolor]|uniref:Uncharacterized protein n=1 Tax=Melipona bicolor TaxID=60889 RepID=A0AA40FQV7_9HYME|nr:hypothetical protein K0M31_008385 [Melipona bicolor]